MKQSSNRATTTAIEVAIYWHDTLDASNILPLSKKGPIFAIGEALECDYPLTRDLLDDRYVFELIGRDEVGNPVVHIPKSGEATGIGADGKSRQTNEKNILLEDDEQVEVALGSLSFRIRSVRVLPAQRRLIAPPKRWLVAAALTLVAQIAILVVVLVKPPRIADAMTDLEMGNRSAEFVLAPASSPQAPKVDSALPAMESADDLCLDPSFSSAPFCSNIE